MKNISQYLGDKMTGSVQWLQQAGCPESVAELLVIALPALVVVCLLYAAVIGLPVLLFLPI